jgi:putative ABC transport system substrate-binding protein
MRRREFITLLGGAAAWPIAVGAQQPARVKRIGLMGNMQLRPIESFRNRLRELGYIEGQNLIVEYRFAEGREERYSGFAAELVALPVDLIVTWGTPAAFAAKHATITIPIVLGGIGDVINTGLVSNLARPGANITGFIALNASSSRNASSCSKRWFPASHGWRCSETAQIRSIVSIWKRLTARPKNFQ